MTAWLKKRRGWTALVTLLTTIPPVVAAGAFIPWTLTTPSAIPTGLSGEVNLVLSDLGSETGWRQEEDRGPDWSAPGLVDGDIRTFSRPDARFGSWVSITSVVLRFDDESGAAEYYRGLDQEAQREDGYESPSNPSFGEDSFYFEERRWPYNVKRLGFQSGSFVVDIWMSAKRAPYLRGEIAVLAMTVEARLP